MSSRLGFSTYGAGGGQPPAANPVDFYAFQGTLTLSSPILHFKNWRQSHGSLTLDDSDVLRWKNTKQQHGTLTLTGAVWNFTDIDFIAPQGTETITDSKTLRYKNWRQAQGTITIDDINVLRWKNTRQQQGTLTLTGAVWNFTDVDFIANQGSLTLNNPANRLLWKNWRQAQGTLTLTQTSQIAWLGLWANEEVVQSGTWTNANAAKGRGQGNADAQVRASTAGNATLDALRLRSSITFSSPGWSLIPGTAIMGAAPAFNLAAGVGESYDIRSQVDFGTLRTPVSGATAAGNFTGDLFTNHLCISDHTVAGANNDVRDDLNNLAQSAVGLVDFIRDTTLEFRHNKAGVAATNVGQHRVDAAFWGCFMFAGTAPSPITTIHNFISGDWNHSNLISDNNRIESNAINADAQGIHNTNTFRSFDVFWRCGIDRPLVGTLDVGITFWAAAATLGANAPGLFMRMGTNGANDRFVLRFIDGTQVIDPAAGATWETSTSVSPISRVGNMFWATVRWLDDDRAHIIVRYMWPNVAAGSWFIITDQVYPLILGDNPPGRIGVLIQGNASGNGWIDDLFVIAND